MMQERESQALDAVPGLINKESCEALYRLASSIPTHLAIVNIGVYKGRSTCYLAAGARAGRGAMVYAIDPWDLEGNEGGRFGYDSHDLIEEFIGHINRLSLLNVVGMQKFSTEAALEWNEEVQVGLLFIDGSHTYRDVKQDFLSWAPYLDRKLPSVVIFDDYNTKKNPGVKAVVDELVKDGIIHDPDLSFPPLAVSFIR